MVLIIKIMDYINIHENYPTENIRPQSQHHRKTQDGRPSGSHLVQLPPQSRSSLNGAAQGFVYWRSQSLPGQSYHNLCKTLFQCLITLIVKNIFSISIQNFSCCTVHPLPLVLSLCSKEKTKLIKNSGTLVPEGFLFIAGILSFFHHEHHPISMQWVTDNKLHCLPIDFPGYSFAWGYPGIIFSSLALKFSSSCLTIYWHSAIVRKLWLSSKSKRR